jgi:hypothetical protein
MDRKISKNTLSLIFFMAITAMAGSSVFPLQAFADEDVSAPPIFYEEKPEDEDEEWIEESLGAEGSPVKDYEYRDQWEKQSQKIRNEASLPFGQAGIPFGQKKPGFTGSPTPSPSSSARPAASPTPSPVSQRRVLVS